jgi:hypothetical protein
MQGNRKDEKSRQILNELKWRRYWWLVKKITELKDNIKKEKMKRCILVILLLVCICGCANQYRKEYWEEEKRIKQDLKEYYENIEIRRLNGEQDKV